VTWSEFDPLQLSAVQFDRKDVLGIAVDTATGMGMTPDVVEPLSHGGAAILDRKEGAVWWFQRGPESPVRVARRGDSPSELSAPSDLAVMGDSIVFVMDRGNHRISRFEPRPDGLAYVGAIPHDPGGELCALGNRLFVNAWIDGLMIHELGPGGEIIRSFGRPPQVPGSELFGKFRSFVEAGILTGPFLCLSDPELIISVPAGVPTITAFRSDGRLAWQTTLADFHPVVYQTTEGRALRATFNPTTGSHLARSAVRWSRGALLIQYAVVRDNLSAPALDRTSLDSRLIDLAKGQELARTATLPRFLARSAEYAYIAKRIDSMPLVEVGTLRIH
jgi:hypothetical protein